MFQVQTTTYSGPLEKLVELIDEKQLSITTVNIAEVTGDFLDYVKRLEDKNEPRILADFLVIAAKLILIKSKTLLPSLELTDEEEEDIHDLESRLKLYKRFKTASKEIEGTWNKAERAHTRELFIDLGSTSLFYPQEDMSTNDLVLALERVMAVIKTFLPEEDQEIRITIVSIEEKVQELMRRFTESVTHSFNTLSGNKSKKEIIALFLAVLHMFRDNVIKLNQTSQFGDINVEKKSEEESVEIETPAQQ